MDTQNNLRGDGKIPIISVEAENLAEAAHKTIVACYEKGLRIETPKHRPGMTLGYDADITVRINHPEQEPKICMPAMYEDPRGLMQYILEVTHGIHNHWKKDKEHPQWWGYTYNERFVDQLPFIFQRIKHDWQSKKGEWGADRGRPTGRDYQFAIWRAGEDIVLEQEDPPCWQLGQIRLTKNSADEIVMSYLTHWRSRDLAKAWEENNVAQIKLMTLLSMKISDVLDTPIKLGCYIDHCSSLHLYGFYFDRDNFERTAKMLQQTPYQDRSIALDDYLDDPKRLKRIVAAQSDAEKKGHGLNVSEQVLTSLGYDLDNFPYPAEWDTWPKSWDAEPDIEKLARVVDTKAIGKSVVGALNAMIR